MCEQPAFGVEEKASAVMGKPAGTCGRDHAVTGNDQRKGVVAAGLTDGAGRAAQSPGQFAIAAGFSAGNGGNGLPDTLAEWTALRP